MSEQKYVSEEPSKTMNITENINRESAKIENITGNKGYTLSGNKDITRATKYSIQNPAHLKEIENFLNTQTIKSEIKQNEKKGRTPSEDPEKRYEKIVTYYEMYYTGFSDFKRKIFTCTGIDYDPSSGKVCGIHFEEVNVEEYQQNQQSENNDNI